MQTEPGGISELKKQNWEIAGYQGSYNSHDRVSERVAQRYILGPTLL